MDSDLENPLAEGLEVRRTPEPTTIVLFGATGDLTERKLLPALYNLGREGLLPSKLAIVGVARRPISDHDFRERMAVAIRDHARLFEAADHLWPRFAESIFYHSTTFEDLDGFRGLVQRLEAIERDRGLSGHRLYYLATAPHYFAPIVKTLAVSGLTGQRRPTAGSARVVVEKPIGHDLESARALNQELLEVLREEQIFRIDHYLGKETVQNLLALRFANGIFEPLWNHKYVHNVQITVAESLGVEGRGGYYDRAGALRDMIQNHLLQVLSLVAMEPPVAMEADSIRDEKVKVLRAIPRYRPDEVSEHVVRGQYTGGSILGGTVSGYRQEDDVPPDTQTETFVALRLFIESWRWAGVPFFLRSGKRLAKRATEVAIEFRKPPLQLFGPLIVDTVAPNVLIINIQPDEGIALRFGAKVPGPDIRVQQVKMDFRYGSSFGVPSPEAYERLLLDALGGDSTLFTRRDEVEAQWTLVQSILEGWARYPEQPSSYPAGSWGPGEADRLVREHETRWRRL